VRRTFLPFFVSGFLVVSCTSTPSVPDVMGLEEQAAIDAIQEAGFSAKSVEVRDDEAEEGTVVRSRPSAGSSPDPESEVIISVASPPKPLMEAWEECKLSQIDSEYDASLEDGGTTLLLPGRGEDDPSEEMLDAFMTQGCVIRALGTRTSVVSRIETTRAMDGVQTAESDGLSYTWSYHPDSGLNLIIEESE
jgi:hypothetical protein